MTARDRRTGVETVEDENGSAAGHRARAERARELAAEMAGVSREANDRLGDSPDWETSRR